MQQLTTRAWQFAQRNRPSNSLFCGFLAAGRRLLPAMALLLSAGCHTVQRARDVQNPAGMQPGERTVRVAELQHDTNALLTVGDAVRLAITNSPIVFQARANLLVAESQLQETRANYLPQVTGSAGYDRTKNYIPSKKAVNIYSTGVSLSQDLLSFGRKDAALRQAKALREAAEAQLQSAINTATYSARIAFFDLLRAQDLLEIAIENVHEFDVHLAQVRVMANLGTRIRYDITKAEVDLGNARLAALTASNTLLTARATLGRTLGLTEELPCQLATPVAALPPIPEDRETLYLRGRRSNPDLTALQCLADAASAGVDFAIADLYPDLSFNAGVNWSGTGGAPFPLGRNWSFGPSLDWSLFNGWRKTSAVDVAAAELQINRAQIADREQQLFQDLITALTQVQTARTQSEVAEIVVCSARESLDLVNARYRVGLATSVERTDAEVAVAQARAQQVQAQHDELAAKALILLNIGE